MYEENGIAKKCWRTIATIKDILLIDNGLPVNFWVETMDTSNYLQNKLFIKRSKCIVIPKEA